MYGIPRLSSLTGGKIGDKLRQITTLKPLCGASGSLREKNGTKRFKEVLLIDGVNGTDMSPAGVREEDLSGEETRSLPKGDEVCHTGK